MTIKEKKSQRDREKKQLLGKILDNKKMKTWDIYSKDKDFKELRRNFDKIFAKKFDEAYRIYLEGKDWATAEDKFSQCLKMKPNDGPSLTLKRYIEEQNLVPPKNWANFRELTEK